MNLLEPIKFKGIWYLPNSPERKLVGELVYDPHKGSILEVYDNFEDNILSCLEEDIVYDIILGYVEGNRYITLHSVFFHDSGNIKFDDKEPSKPYTKYYVNCFFVDCKVEKKEDLLFKGATVHIHNIEEWAGLNGMTITMPTKEANIHYSTPEPIKFTLPYNGVNAELNNHLGDYRISGYINEFKLSQKTDFILESEESKPFRELMVYVFRFVQFVTLGFYQGTFIDSYLLSIEGQEKKVSLYYRQNYLNEGRRLKTYDMFFRYNDISKCFQSIIDRWYSLAKEIDEIMLLLYDQFKNGSANTQSSFLNTAQIAESFHAFCYDHKRTEGKGYKAYVKEIIKAAPAEYKKQIADRLNSGNGLTLAERLSELVDKCPQKIKETYFGNSSLYVSEVKDSRNYYTHYSEKGKKHILRGYDLKQLTERTKLLIALNLLVYLDIDNKTIESLVLKGHRLFNKLQ